MFNYFSRWLLLAIVLLGQLQESLLDTVAYGFHQFPDDSMFNSNYPAKSLFVYWPIPYITLRIVANY